MNLCLIAIEKTDSPATCDEKKQGVANGRMLNFRTAVPTTALCTFDYVAPRFKSSSTCSDVLDLKWTMVKLPFQPQVSDKGLKSSFTEQSLRVPKEF